LKKLTPVISLPILLFTVIFICRFKQLFLGKYLELGTDLYEHSFSHGVDAITSNTIDLSSRITLYNLWAERRIILMLNLVEHEATNGI
jgi:hypothetical protein